MCNEPLGENETFLTVIQSVPLLRFLYEHSACDCNDITGLDPPIPLQKGRSVVLLNVLGCRLTY